MIVFPNCKINLGLNITGKRPDGYHNLETIFFPVKWYDILEIIRTEKTNNTETFIASGIIATANSNDNICLKAFTILKNDFPDRLPAVEFYLHKTIPTGSGLGGGSADAAFTLTLLNKHFQLGLSTEQLINYASRLGSDCPFFIINQPCFSSGRGEILEPVSLDLSTYKIILVNPQIHIATNEAFARIVPAVPVKPVKEIIQQPVTTWKEELKNDFEIPVFEKYPEIGDIKKQLYECGAIYASLSGSGSTVYGIFPNTEVMAFNFPPHYSCKESTG